jgi:hypothetical protein
MGEHDSALCATGFAGKLTRKPRMWSSQVSIACVAVIALTFPRNKLFILFAYAAPG